MRRGAVILVLAALALVPLLCTGGGPGHARRQATAATTVIGRARMVRRPVRHAARPVVGPMAIAEAFVGAELVLERTPSARRARRAQARTATSGLVRLMRRPARGPREAQPQGTLTGLRPIASGPRWLVVEAGVTYTPGLAATVELELLRRRGRWRVAAMRVAR